MKRCEYRGEERRGAKRRTDKDAHTWKYDVQRRLASLVANTLVAE